VLRSTDRAIKKPLSMKNTATASVPIKPKATRLLIGSVGLPASTSAQRF